MCDAHMMHHTLVMQHGWRSQQQCASHGADMGQGLKNGWSGMLCSAAAQAVGPNGYPMGSAEL